MIIKKPRQQDLLRLKQLWQEAFGDPEDFIELFFAKGFSEERCLCVFQEDAPCAALYWFDCSWKGQKIAYLYAVATAKSHRNRGLSRALMEFTHGHLHRLGYRGAALVPGSKYLFSFYEKFGYRGFCPMKKRTVPAGTVPVALTPISKETYEEARATLLPPDGILQTGAVLDFLSGYAGFYQCNGAIACVSCQNGELFFQEYLGDSTLLGGIISALGGTAGHVRLPGGNENFAMYRSFTEDKLPAYLGIALD